MRIGVISDTHDLIRPSATSALAGVDQILHCGDVCSAAVLDELRRIAPVFAVRGNCDHGAWALALPQRDTWSLGGVLIHAVHDPHDLDLDPETAGIGLVVHGHTHTPFQEERGGVLFLNPGSAGPIRARLPVTLAVVTIESGALRSEFVQLA